jgi:hypothetical protein
MSEWEREQYGGYVIRYHYDSDAMDPRNDYDTFGTMLCSHGRYNLGDNDARDMYVDECDSWAEVAQCILRDNPGAVVIPLHLIDHSGIAMRAGRDFGDCDPGHWDSGQVGFIFATRQQILDNWGGKIVTAKRREEATALLLSIVEEYSSYLEGDVHGYVAETHDGTPIDSCWGFIGSEYVRAEAHAAVDCHLRWLHDELENGKASVDLTEALALAAQLPKAGE